MGEILDLVRFNLVATCTIFVDMVHARGNAYVYIMGMPLIHAAWGCL